jgi:hypothetical protein
MIDMLLPFQAAAKSKPGAVHSQEFTLLFKLRINLIDPEGYSAPLPLPPQLLAFCCTLAGFPPPPRVLEGVAWALGSAAAVGAAALCDPDAALPASALQCGRWTTRAPPAAGRSTCA